MKTKPSGDYRTQAETWLADDPDPSTRDALRALLDDGAALQALFQAPLAFGTAGLRGPLGPGPSRMNRRVVAQTTAGLCRYLEGQDAKAKERGLCVARDARHGSEAFFDEVIQVALGAGFTVHAFSEVAPTPLLAFAVQTLEAAGGVVITASHNPKQDNGYKVFLQGGAQLVAPHDRGIAEAANHIERVRSLPRVAQTDGRTHGTLRACDAVMTKRYREGLRRYLGQGGGDGDPTAVRIAYSPLHGVAGPLAKQVLQDAGFVDLHVVASQADPNPDFPTLAFPNPEEPGSVDALLSLAAEVNADVALANDPDGDRLAVAVRDAAGQFARLTGNQVGVLLADYALSRHGRSTHRSPSDAPPLVCSTIVSSPMLDDIAGVHGARLERTLTGFKWMFARVRELEREGYHLVFGFEDAMGYAATPLVRDKDGLSAAVLMAQLTAACKRDGCSVGDRLQLLFERHGLHESALRSVVLAGPAARQTLANRMQSFRTAPPTTLGGASVISVSDYLSGIRRAGQQQTALALPASNVLVLELTDGRRVCIRPSGTEPKLKLYFDIRTLPKAGETRAATRDRAKKRMKDLISATLTRLEQT